MNRASSFGSRRNARRGSDHSFNGDQTSSSYSNIPFSSSYNSPSTTRRTLTSQSAQSSRNAPTLTSSYGNGARGSDIPHAYADCETGLRRNSGPPRSRGSSCRSYFFKFVTLSLFVLATGYSYVSYQERKLMKTQLGEYDAAMRELEINLSMKYDTQVKELKKENTSLQHKLSGEKDLKMLNQNLNDEKHALEKRVTGAIEELKSSKTTAEMLSRSRDKVYNNIQRTSKDAVLHKFGKGPHRLEINLRFDSHLGFDDGGPITIEMAPIDELPHAVHWFLEQVDRKLYDGFSFHRNAGHVVQAGAVTNFLSGDRRPSQDGFRNAGFHSLLFQEYSDKFPHQKYTLGFAGRPAGPMFYINTVDNTKAHGPGGQDNHHDPSEADTCFAKVINGFDLVDRMHKLPVEGAHKGLKDNVAITSIRLLKQ